MSHRAVPVAATAVTAPRRWGLVQGGVVLNVARVWVWSIHTAAPVVPLSSSEDQEGRGCGRSVRTQVSAKREAARALSLQARLTRAARHEIGWCVGGRSRLSVPSSCCGAPGRPASRSPRSRRRRAALLRAECPRRAWPWRACGAPEARAPGAGALFATRSPAHPAHGRPLPGMALPPADAHSKLKSHSLPTPRASRRWVFVSSHGGSQGRD